MAHELSSPEQWLTLYGDVLFRYGLARVRDAEIAEDLVQETFLAALKAQENFAGQSSEKTWLIGILKHKMIDYFRKASHEQIQAFDEQLIADDNEDFFDQHGGWKVDFSNWSQPDQSMQQDQFMQVLQQCIERLPQRLSQLFMLSEFDDMKSEEICKVLSISSMNNYWVMLSRIRVQLRYCLDINWINR